MVEAAAARRAKYSAWSCQVLPSSRERSPIQRNESGLMAVKLHRTVSPIWFLPSWTMSLSRACKVLPQRIAPKDMPGVYSRIVDAQRRAAEDSGQNPHVLDGAAFEHPAEMNFALAVMLGAVVAVYGRAKSPASDQPTIESHLVGAIGCRAVATKRVDKRTWDHDQDSRCICCLRPYLESRCRHRLGKIAKVRSWR